MSRLFTVRLAGTVLLTALWGGNLTAASAQTSGSFSPDQRRQIVEIMRDALKSDPTILSDAIVALRQGAEQQEQSKALGAVRADKAALQTAPAYAVRGNTNGDLTVVEFLDPRCGYCRSLVPVVDKLLADDPKLRLVEKVVPVLSEKSMLDTQAIFAAARQGGYDKMKRALMQDTATPSVERIRQLASANGLDADRLAKDMHDPDVSTQINTNLAQARAIGLDGTPTFVFGTDSIAPGAMSLQDMQGKIAAARRARG
ncbi:hypothetical protein AA101099_1840 [Neoasaia chiangmaiensis NBRC 101099]|uniref:Uncharacterized protein n=1 Tax=Neoasaia chiangmaiensis TaxID=320497 RepID=A0A1U9KUK6_9PROT|nr:DsbA family protein [Neoasaia chiangmaiensis]AQS89432.1 hypothetical protein A0U93_09965 [Neoasaia chiangmaiensis]GBR39837.1 hypothetical protein AA101099_1840 [Neoasaia chiangmaiensis NBRC 101099]GEN14764.1 membrane protein [Neoasaia chiangmaiensis]